MKKHPNAHEEAPKDGLDEEPPARGHGRGYEGEVDVGDVVAVEGGEREREREREENK